MYNLKVDYFSEVYHTNQTIKLNERKTNCKGDYSGKDLWKMYVLSLE